MKITALTCFCVDHFPETEKIHVGGNSLNYAVQCWRSGEEDVSVVGAVGNDEFGSAVKSYLDKTLINTEKLYIVDSPTASNKIYLDENRDRYFKDDSWNGGAYSDFRLSDNDILYLKTRDIIAMPATDPNFELMLKERTSSQIVAIDFLDFFSVEFIAKHIDKIDIVFLSAKDSLLDELAALSLATNALIVATRGSKGSVAFFGDQKFYKEAPPAKTVVDTTGCGDAFQAAFSIEYACTKDIKNALARGSEAAGHVLSFSGGVEGEV